MSEWQMHKRPDALKPGDRIIFSDAMGGEGETVTVECVTAFMGDVVIHTEELDFGLGVVASQMIEIDLTEEEEDGERKPE